MKLKIIAKEEIKEGDLVQYCGFYILKAKELKEAGFNPDFYFVEDEELKNQEEKS